MFHLNWSWTIQQTPYSYNPPAIQKPHVHISWSFWSSLRQNLVAPPLPPLPSLSFFPPATPSGHWLLCSLDFARLFDLSDSKSWFEVFKCRSPFQPFWYAFVHFIRAASASLIRGLWHVAAITGREPFFAGRTFTDGAAIGAGRSDTR